MYGHDLLLCQLW